MKIIEYTNGQILNRFETLKELLPVIRDNYTNNKDFIQDDESLFIQYKDGTEYFLSAMVEYGIFKRTGIRAVVIDTPDVYMIYGKAELKNVGADSYDYYVPVLV